MARLKPTERTIKKLFALSGNQCAHPECSNVLIDPSGTVLAEICHIEAAEEKGPRFNPDQNDEDRRAFENLFLLCSIHHTLIDDQPENYSAESLKKWKKEHEDRYRDGRYLNEEQIAKATREISRPEKIDLTKLPDTDSKLYGRETELSMLHDAWENPQTKIISLIAWGGVGKSALTNAWLNEMDLQDFKGARQVYGWSFYSQGTKEDRQVSADLFLNDALKWFGFEGDIPISQFEKGRLLAAQIAKKKTLLVLDGLEPLQYPLGEMHGHLKDQAMQALLKALARLMNGLCIITSRVKATDLKSTEGKITLTHHLENLDDEAGKLLLEKIYQLKGTGEELKLVSGEFKGHALALNLLGSYLKTVHDGDIRKRDLIPALMEDEKNGGHARRVMKSYERWFEEGNKPELDILNLLGLFDRPASKEAIDVLKAEPAIPGLTNRLANLTYAKWKISLQYLRDLRLIAKKEKNSKSLDCHPLIREHFGEKLKEQNPKVWKEAHSRLYEYYKNLPEKEFPDTLEEMEPLFSAVGHGCLAGKHQEVAVEVFNNRIRRKGEHYTLHKLGVFGSDLACISSFFETLWVKPVYSLSEEYKASVLGNAGYVLRSLGRLQESVQPLKIALERAILYEDWNNASIRANNLNELTLTLGDVKSALEYLKQSVDFADRNGDRFKIATIRARAAYIYFQKGSLVEAEVLFLEAENLQKKDQPYYSYLYSLSGFQFCDLLIYLGKYEEVLDRAKTTIKWVKNQLSIALDKLSIGKALMLRSIQNKSKDFSLATGFLNDALNNFRNAGEQEFIVKGLLARVILYQYKEELIYAWTDLDEALEIAKYGSMKLHLTDYYLETCRVIDIQLKAGNMEREEYKIIENGETLKLSRAEMVEKFKVFFAEAERLINECGYHRRDGELEELWELAKAF